MPKVSVIVPIYGVEKYIARCARSLFEQTLDDIEFLFVDDCTPDRSTEMLKDVLEQYPHRKKQTRIVKMPTNSGLPAVRRYGIQLATGEYIIHCDSDDWVDIEAYEKLYKEAIKGNYDIVFCDYFESDSVTKKRKKRSFVKFAENNVEEVIASNFMWSLWGAMAKRALYDCGIIYPKSNNGEDFALMFQLIYYANSYSYVNEPLYYYFFNPQSITKEPSIDSYIKRVEQHKDNVELLSIFFSRENKRKEYDNILLILKLLCRANFSVKVIDAQTKRKWYSIFPELEQISFVFNSHIPINLKINYWSVRLNIFIRLKKIQKRIKHYV